MRKEKTKVVFKTAFFVIMEEEIEFLEKEIKICDEEIDKAKESAQTAIDCRDYYSRRKDFLEKIEALINNKTY